MRKFVAALIVGALAITGLQAQQDLNRLEPGNLDLQGGAGRGQCPSAGKGLKLQILHSSDNESSFQDPNTLEPKILNYAALYRGLLALGLKEKMKTLHVTVGDHTIPGPFYRASTEVDRFGAPGLADIEIYNEMDLAANGMGNHEFDGTINEFAEMLNAAEYPMVAVNLDFDNVETDPSVPEIEIGKDRTKNTRVKGKVVKSTIVRVGGECIGLIGRAPADFFNVIEDPLNTLGGLDFVGGRDPITNQPLVSAVTQVLEEVDNLEEIGVNKIFLLDHAQDFTGDPLSAQSLRGIDVIIAAGSTGFMAKQQPNGPFNLLRPEDSPSADYPTVREDMEGQDVLVINSDQQYRYIGNLMIEFDADGDIVAVDERSGPIATTEEGKAALAEVLGKNKLNPKESIQRVWDDIQNTALIQNLFTEVATTTAPLNGNRADVRGRETNLGRLAADSTVWGAERELGIDVDVALKNGGGIRDTIVGPSIIRLTIQAALAFDNRLTVLRLSGDQLLATMENSVSRVPAADGRFPQIAGIQLSYDASFPGVENQESLTEASRVRELTITKADGTIVNMVTNGMVNAAALNDSFVLATNSFTATGGDGYAAFAVAEAVAATQTGAQQMREEYIVDALGGTVDLPEPLADPRVVRLD